MFALALNNQNLPYLDPIHSIIVHFVIAMTIFSFIFEVLGYCTRNPNLFKVSFWNLFVAAIAIFLAVIFGQFEAGLANVYDTVEPVLNFPTIMGWSLLAIVVAITAWRFVIRSRNPSRILPAYLGAATFLVCLVFLQTYLGSQLVWVYGLHIEPVVEAMCGS
jgi:uncharacterized membrane protein